jgi:hypothetical protein
VARREAINGEKRKKRRGKGEKKKGKEKRKREEKGSEEEGDASSCEVRRSNGSSKFRCPHRAARWRVVEEEVRPLRSARRGDRRGA